MMVDKIEKRKRKVLKAIIQEHILTAKPVGSRTLAKAYQFGISPATIRNEMSDLEDLGYLKQPHTSAGRIPSDRGYRFYVDVLMDPENKDPRQLKNTLSRFYRNKEGIEDVISGMVKVLSQLTKYTTMISEPELQKSKIKKLELINVARKTILIVLVTDTGIVNNKLIRINEDLNSQQLKKISSYLLKILQNKKLAELDREKLQEIGNNLVHKINLSQQIYQLITEELKRIAKPGDLRVFLGGTSYILEQPEFNDLQTLKEVLKILDHEENLRKLIKNLPNEDLKVKIGQENTIKEMQNCSIVCATYHFGDKAMGKIGVIGPTRMEYPRVISTVDLAADILGKIISEAGE